MQCRTENCHHKQSRRGRINPHTNSWGMYDICPCCAIELKWMEVLPDYQVRSSSGCRALLNKGEVHPSYKDGCTKS